jgi:hypothetical protein
MFKVSRKPKLSGAVPSSAHTYRLSVVKELCLSALRLGRFRIHFAFASLPANRFVCQQQRNEIMQLFSYLVNYFVLLFFKKLRSQLVTSRCTTALPLPCFYLLSRPYCALLSYSAEPRFATGAEL